MRHVAALALLAGCMPGSLPMDGETLALIRGAPFSVDLLTEAGRADFLGSFDTESEEGQAELDAATVALPSPDFWVDDPDILAVGDDPDCDDELDYCPSVAALGLDLGSTTLSWHDPISGAGSLTVSVHDPDRIDVWVADPTLVEDAWIEVRTVKVLVERTAELRLGAWDGDVALVGADMLQLTHDDTLAVKAYGTPGWEGLGVRSNTPGTYDLALGVGGETLGHVTIDVVGPEEAAGIGMSDDVPIETEDGYVLWHRRAWIEDKNGSPILGAKPTWNIGGEENAADRLVYAYHPAGALPVETSFGDAQRIDVLPAREATAYNQGGGAVDPLTGVAALGLGLLGWRARSRP